MRPYGYQADFHTPIEHEADILRDAATRVLDKDESVWSLIQDLNGRREYSVSGKPWQRPTFQRTLCSPRIAGLTPDGKRAAWPGIITPKQHRALVVKLGGRTRKPKAAPAEYILTGGWAVCGRCGTALEANPPRPGQRGYACPRPAKGGCGRLRVLADPLEEHVASMLLARLCAPVNRRTVQRIIAGQQEAAEAAGQVIVEQEKFTAELADDWADGKLTRAEYHRIRDRVQARVRKAKAAQARAELLAGVDWTPEGLAALWNGAGKQTRQALVGMFVDQVVVKPGGGSGRRLDPGRFVIEWRRAA